MKTKVLTAATLLAAAGHVAAQPTINGQLDASFYGDTPLWVQNQPTSRGDNTSTGACVPCNIGNPAGVATGIEWSIPLASIGNPSLADIKLTIAITGDNWQFFSNQVTGGLPCPTTELGIARTVNFASISGNQFVNGIQVSATAPVVDGTLDAAYGQPLFLQTNRTGFGDASLGLVANANGSEMNSAYAVVNGDRLYVFLPGNLASDFTRVQLFVDSLPGVGQNVMRNDNPDISFNRLNGLGPDPNNPAAGPGLTFDAGFAADFVFTVVGNGSSTFTDYARLRDVPTVGDPGVGFYVGSGAYGSGAALTGGNAGADPVSGTLVTVDNRNTAGVLGNCPPAANPHVAVGSEINGLYGRIFNNKLYVLLTGNLANNFDKVQFFIDAVPGGQNVINAANVDIDFNTINRMAGLKFDDGFEADYFLNYGNGNGSTPTTIEHFATAAVMRTNGRLTNANGESLDYGAFQGGLKSSFLPFPPGVIPFDGPRIDPLGTAIFTNFAPRTAGLPLLGGASVGIGVPNLIRTTIDNSNTGGVTSTSATPPSVSGAASVTTGLEFEIDLAELTGCGQGTNPPCSTITSVKLVALLTYSGPNDTIVISNQVVGGLPTPTGEPFAPELGNSQLVDFSQIAGNQFVVITTQPSTGCYANCDGSTGTPALTPADFVCFLNKFRAGC